MDNMDKHRNLYSKILVYLSLFCAVKGDPESFICKDYFRRHSINRNNTDVVFVLDRSGSVGAANFETEVGFVGRFLTDFVVAPDATRIAVISFSNDARVHFDYIKDNGNKCVVTRDLHSITYTDSRATNTAAGLLKALDVFKNARTTSEKVLVLVTDGVHTQGPDPAEAANLLKNIGVQIHVFGIGRYLKTQLGAIASSPNHTCETETFTVFKNRYGNGVKNQWNSYDTPEACDRKCHRPSDDQHGCCDTNAICGCSVTTGLNDCLCKPGYFGNGLKGHCEPCQWGSYQDEFGQSACKVCPITSTTEDVGSKSIEDCKCETGYKRSPGDVFACTEVTCPPLQSPEHGRKDDHCSTEYDSQCCFYCDEGYMLEDPYSNCRMCQDDGTWSSDTTVCIPSRCDRKPVFANGYLECTGQATFNTTCRYTCQKGYKLVGDSTTTCLGEDEWSGDTPKCELVGCADPPKVRFSRRRGNEMKKEFRFSDLYQVECLRGFKPVGSPAYICDQNGRWSLVGQQPPQCNDTEPPRITCPVNLKIHTEENRNNADISWKLPQVKDNSRLTPTIIHEPKSLTSPAKLKIGSYKIVYYAVDHANLTSTCTQQIDVVDNQPPTVTYCPGDIYYEHNSTDTKAAVHWRQPEFSDNSGGNVTVSQSHQSGDLFNFGTHNITYRATDPSGSSSYCKFNVHVSLGKCPYHPPPLNGALSCEDLRYGELCQVLCNDRYDFVEEPADWYICEPSREWSTEPEGMSLPWPDCSVPRSATLKKAYQAFYFTGDCREEKVKVAIREIFRKNFDNFQSKERFCGQEAACVLDSIAVYCGVSEDDNGANRVRRSISSKEEYTIAEVDAELRFIPSMNTTTDIDELSKSVDATFSNLGKVPENVLDGVVAESNVSLHMKLLESSIKNTFLVCGEGMVLSGQQCVTCPAGTCHDKTQDICSPCVKGEYQDEEGSTSCKSCPANTMTETLKSSSADDCRATCSKGTYSSTGLETCMSCPRGTYQDETHQTSCKTCPSGTTTEMISSTGIEDCKLLCLPGTMSETGLEPCLPCGKGFYQSYSGQRSCDECVFPLTTNQTGSTSSLDCDEFDHCLSEPCQNNGTCDSSRHDFICLCPPGFYGKVCDLEKTPCHGEPCMNGGSCLVKGDHFQCSCTASYEGERCEIPRDLCEDVDCPNGEDCVVEDGIAYCDEDQRGADPVDDDSFLAVAEPSHVL